MPAALVTEPLTLRSRDGTELFAEWHPSRSPGHSAALIVHGYAEHGGRYRELATELGEAGVASLAIDLRGHGRSQGPRGHILRFEEYLEDIEAGLEAAAARADGGRLALIAHSNGALAALRILADPYRTSPPIAAAVFSSPFLALREHISPFKRAIGALASRVLPALTLPNEIDIQTLTHDPEKLKERRLDTLCHDVASARWYTEAVATQAWVLEFAHRVEVPSLWLVAGEDAIAYPSASRRVAERIPAPLDYRELDGLYHEVLNETARADLFSAINEFLEQHLAV